MFPAVSGLPSEPSPAILWAMSDAFAPFGPTARTCAQMRGAMARPLAGLLRLVLIGDRRAR
ncbi:hypothetical protein D3218_07440 [Aureimonas flava]|uniref:Uncharacterized protein n=1 Tax=Aureimonas flava TaxID=2320271 RepID=A0A3A1WVG6_9HYPH|nr:hypothetical protein D3218_07440 [Aureimonas flava]